jgi:hypothetical protein
MKWLSERVSVLTGVMIGEYEVVERTGECEVVERSCVDRCDGLLTRDDRGLHMAVFKIHFGFWNVNIIKERCSLYLFEKSCLEDSDGACLWIGNETRSCGTGRCMNESVNNLCFLFFSFLFKFVNLVFFFS